LIQNPEERPWVDNAEEYGVYKGLHEQFAALHAADEIDVSHDTDAMREGDAGSGDTGAY
jgi:hypothetical protein